MKVRKEDFYACATEELLTPEQAEALWIALENRVKNHHTRYDLISFIYALSIGTMIAAMSWLISWAWYRVGGVGIFTTSLFYILAFTLAGALLWHRQNRQILGGFLVLLAVALIPLAVYGLLLWLQVWPQVKLVDESDYLSWLKISWFVIELATILGAFLAIKVVPLPILTVPIIICLWLMAIDVTPLILGIVNLTWEQQLLVSLWFGLTCLAVAYGIDLREKRNSPDYAFWFYFFGLFTFWSGISLMGGQDIFQRFLYLLINLGLVLLSLLLKRRIFMMFGAAGVSIFLYQLAISLLNKPVLLGLIFTGLSLGILGLGWLFSNRRYSKLKQPILGRLPQRLRQFFSVDS